ncbi:hypothetical protein ACOMHN_049384 [Nucella lapillus]
MGDVANFASSEDDPYITLKNDGDSDEEDTDINATDNLIVCGRCEGDMSVMEVYVYNEENSQLYVHHDYLLSSFPLVIEWLNFDGYENAPGNFVALGTMDPVIEILDLDIMESVGPMLTLGSQPEKSKKKGKKKESGTGHSQAVLDLSWNPNARHVLASASADTTVALWDLTEGKVATTLTQHSRESVCHRHQSELPDPRPATSEDKAFNIWDIHADKPSPAFSPEAPFVFAVEGRSRDPRVWDIRESATVRQQFLNRMPASLVRECEGDDKDVANNDKDDDAVTAMKRLEMEDEEEENAAAAAAAPSPSKR